MKYSTLLALTVAVLVSAGFIPTCIAEAPATSPDKSQYTLFDPTPTSELRGMSTDRPNATNSPQTIDAGHLQIETGVVDYTYYHDRYKGASAQYNQWGFGQFNFRLGVLDNLELNAAFDSFDYATAHDNYTHSNTHAEAFGDTVVGAKLNFWGNEISDQTWATAMAIQPQFKFPTDQSDLGNGRFEAVVGLPFMMNLPAGFHLSYEPAIGMVRSFDNTGYVTSIENAICVDRVVWKNLDVYVEYASALTTESHVKPIQTIDLGCTYALTDNIVLDGGVNLGLNNASNTVEAMAGVSVRF
ncbi:MAG TPA: transporter [Tepidisphaeraceae bacterium]|nr:transporter [Tepidisphaeraceae bacterium]